MILRKFKIFSAKTQMKVQSKITSIFVELNEVLFHQSSALGKPLSNQWNDTWDVVWVRKSWLMMNWTLSLFKSKESYIRDRNVCWSQWLSAAHSSSLHTGTRYEWFALSERKWKWWKLTSQCLIEDFGEIEIFILEGLASRLFSYATNTKKVAHKRSRICHRWSGFECWGRSSSFALENGSYSRSLLW